MWRWCPSRSTPTPRWRLRRRRRHSPAAPDRCCASLGSHSHRPTFDTREVRRWYSSPAAAAGRRRFSAIPPFQRVQLAARAASDRRSPSASEPPHVCAVSLVCSGLHQYRHGCRAAAGEAAASGRRLTRVWLLLRIHVFLVKAGRCCSWPWVALGGDAPGLHGRKECTLVRFSKLSTCCKRKSKSMTGGVPSACMHAHKCGASPAVKRREGEDGVPSL